MNDRQLFEEVLDRLIRQYDLLVEHPYDDDCIALYHDGRKLAELNPSGRNLLANLYSLTTQLSGLLR